MLLSRNRILIIHNREYKAYKPEDISSIQVGDVTAVYNGEGMNSSACRG